MLQSADAGNHCHAGGGKFHRCSLNGDNFNRLVVSACSAGGKDSGGVNGSSPAVTTQK